MSKNKKKLLIVFSISSVFIVWLLVFLSCYYKYFGAVNLYNSDVEKYNKLVDRYREIVQSQGVSWNQISERYEKIEESDNGLLSCVSFIFAGNVLSDIYAEVSDIEDKEIQLENIIENAEAYVSLIDEYNSLVYTFNSSQKEFYKTITGEENSIEPAFEFENLDNYIASQDAFLLGDFSNELDRINKYISNLNEKQLNNDEFIENVRQYIELIASYNELVDQYNELVNEYNKLLEKSDVSNIAGIKKRLSVKSKVLFNINRYNENPAGEFDSVKGYVSNVENDIKEILTDYMMLYQITAPEEDWVIDKLKQITDITGVEAVSKANDPTGLYGKEGAFESCIYFTIKDIDVSGVKGNSIVAKGTDAGGAIEIYETADEAMARCEYLSGFDGTILNSGSYAIVGTLVIRTSYKLSESRQYELTSIITEKLLEL